MTKYIDFIRWRWRKTSKHDKLFVAWFTWVGILPPAIVIFTPNVIWWWLAATFLVILTYFTYTAIIHLKKSMEDFEAEKQKEAVNIVRRLKGLPDINLTDFPGPR